MSFGLGNTKGPDEKRIKQLANSVEEYTVLLLEPLKADQERQEEFGSALDEILDDAIQLNQKEVCLNVAADSAFTPLGEQGGRETPLL